MKSGAIVSLVFFVAATAALITILVFALIEQKKVNDFVIPSGYVLVKYDDDNFVVMDSSRQKFLVWWDTEYHSMESEIGNLKGGKIEMKRHLMEYIEELRVETEKKEIEARVKNQSKD